MSWCHAQSVAMRDRFPRNSISRLSVVQAGEVFMVRDVRVFDGECLSDADSVIVRGGHVVQVGRGLPVPADATVIDGAGGTLLPGLIDGHTHTPPDVEYAERAMRQALRFGVTTVMCLGTEPATAAAMKQRAADRFDLADVRSAGTIATAPGSHPTQLSEHEYPTLAGPADAGPFIDSHIAAGMDHVKIAIEDGAIIGRPMPCISPELTAAVTAEAHQRGLLVIAHAQLERLALQALDAGVDGLAHQYLDQPQSPEIAERMRRSGTFVCLTLAVYHSGEGARLVRDPRISPLVEPNWLDHLSRGLGSFEPYTTYTRTVLDSVPVLADAGVTIVAGTDAPNPGTAHGASLHHELELLVRGGLTPLHALAAATSVVADCYQLPDRGRISPGQRADLLLVDGDPTTDITRTLNIKEIWRTGQQLNRAR